MSNGGQLSSSSHPILRSSTLKCQGSRSIRHQRTGASSKHVERAEEFQFTDLDAATNNFSLENKIGTGSFGVVYKGKLLDSHEFTIKHGCLVSSLVRLNSPELLNSGACDSHCKFFLGCLVSSLVRLNSPELLNSGACDSHCKFFLGCLVSSLLRLNSPELLNSLLEIRDPTMLEYTGYVVVVLVEMRAVERPVVDTCIKEKLTAINVR
ncbi:hypothetical protein T459_21672 [Capsicum annuum]|uniref:Protein kinase domain-containing protein n=1 Tax=Capsicum annuum TaxID=4072 RepID=A0A2G2YXQ4_CAPAN|nr:hypothetical protein T459_21672 [Capsicum annuum]